MLGCCMLLQGRRRRRERAGEHHPRVPAAAQQHGGGPAGAQAALPVYLPTSHPTGSTHHHAPSLKAQAADFRVIGFLPLIPTASYRWGPQAVADMAAELDSDEVARIASAPLALEGASARRVVSLCCCCCGWAAGSEEGFLLDRAAGKLCFHVLFAACPALKWASAIFG